jgi:Zn-dependent protease
MFGGWWVSNFYQMGGPALVAAWAIWVIVSITLHELAHGWAAINRGDMTPIHTGHMTWNPLVHMGLTSIIVFAITGIAWGLMPIDPTRMRGRYAEAFVAFAGPLMNLVLAIICIIGGGVALAMLTDAQFDQFRDKMFGVGPNTPIAARIAMFCGVGAMLNISLFLFNLLPCPPLDGSRIIACFSNAYRNFLMTQGGQFLSMIVFVLAFVLSGPVIFGVGMVGTVIGMGGIYAVLKLVGVGP